MASHSRRVYSTDGDNRCPTCSKALYKCRCPDTATAPPSHDGILRVQRESKGRGGKQVTVIYGINENTQQLKKLLKQIKSHCGSGGTVKDGALEIQGDQRDKIIKLLQSLDYQVKRSGG